MKIHSTWWTDPNDWGLMPDGSVAPTFVCSVGKSRRSAPPLDAIVRLVFEEGENGFLGVVSEIVNQEDGHFFVQFIQHDGKLIYDPKPVLSIDWDAL